MCGINIWQSIWLSIGISIFHMFLLLHTWLQWIFLYIFWSHLQGFLQSICPRIQLMCHSIYKSSNLVGHAELFSKVVIPIFIFLYDYLPSMFHLCQDDYSCLFLIFLVTANLLLLISFPGNLKKKYLNMNTLSVVCIVSQFLACKLWTSLHQVSPSFLLVRSLG